MTFLNLSINQLSFKSNFFIVIIFTIYIKIFKNLSAKYYEENKVVNNMLIPLLVRCNFNLFKLCCILFLLWSIRFMLLFVYISFRWLFTSWALCWCLSFLVIMLEIETSQVGDFAGIARPTINFAISLGSLSDGMSLVPTWKIIAPWDALTYTLQFAVLPSITYHLKVH